MRAVSLFLKKVKIKKVKIMKTTIISFLIAIIFLGNSSNVFSLKVNDPSDFSKKASISGKVTDKKTGEILAGALISIKGTDIKIYSDLEGNFNINNIEPGNYELEINYISYSPTEIKNISLNAGEFTKIEIEILPN